MKNQKVSITQIPIGEWFLCPATGMTYKVLSFDDSMVEVVSQMGKRSAWPKTSKVEVV